MSVAHLFLKACFRQPTPRRPVWMMRQAGRYLPEYLATRKRAGDFLTLCKTPEMACEVTLQPIDILGVDAAILFSDILVVPEAMGMELAFETGEGPKFAAPIRSRADIDKLADPDPEVELRYVMDAIRLIRKELNGRAPLIGFTGAPWTLATYMVEGGGSKNFALIKKMAYADPQAMHRLLERVTDAVVRYLSAQVAAGAQALQIFDTWGGILSKADFLEFSLPYIARIVQGVPRVTPQGERVPVIVFVKGGGQWLEAIAGTGCDVMGLDWTVDLAEAHALVGDRVALQGNLDPCALYAPVDVIARRTRAMKAAFGSGPGHIVNLGHGILPDIPVAHARAFVQAAQEQG
ncbi:MAG: uroporphyrinogen decarboxylase [Nitrospirae bacterium]|nr:uroporphyrinogen decarboxylase [Nitrospirota bacterium]